MAKAVGVGGVFLKSRDPQALSAWYAAHFGIEPGEGGSLVFDGPESTGMTVFAHFPLDTPYFGDGPQQFMVNLRVDDLDQLLTQLAAAGVRIAQATDVCRLVQAAGGGCHSSTRLPSRSQIQAKRP